MRHQRGGEVIGGVDADRQRLRVRRDRVDAIVEALPLGLLRRIRDQRAGGVDVVCLRAREVAVRGAETDDELAIDRARVTGQAVCGDNGDAFLRGRGAEIVRQR